MKSISIILQKKVALVDIILAIPALVAIIWGTLG